MRRTDLRPAHTDNFSSTARPNTQSQRSTRSVVNTRRSRPLEPPPRTPSQALCNELDSEFELSTNAPPSDVPKRRPSKGLPSPPATSQAHSRGGRGMGLRGMNMTTGFTRNGRGPARTIPRLNTASKPAVKDVIVPKSGLGGRADKLVER